MKVLALVFAFLLMAGISSANKEMADVNLDDINTSKPMSAEELKQKVLANPAEWKGKKVAVTGLYQMHATSDGINATSAYRTDLKEKIQASVGCYSKARPALWDDFQKNYARYAKEKIVVKGVIAGTVDYGKGTSYSNEMVGLEPCVIITTAK